MRQIRRARSETKTDKCKVPPDPRQRLTQRPFHRPDRITTAPHRPNQFLLFDTKPNRTHTHPNLHQHIIIIGPLAALELRELFLVGDGELYTVKRIGFRGFRWPRAKTKTLTQAGMTNRGHRTHVSAVLSQVNGIERPYAEKSTTCTSCGGGPQTG